MFKNIDMYLYIYIYIMYHTESYHKYAHTANTFLANNMCKVLSSYKHIWCKSTQNVSQ